MMNDEKKYSDLIKTLKELQQVKAPSNFEADLKRKINEEKFEAKSKRSVKDFLIPSRLIPSFGIAGAAIVVVLILNINSEEIENPFMMEPKVREDIITIEDTDLLKKQDGERSTMMDTDDKNEVVEKKNKELGRERMQGNNLPESNIVAESESFIPESTLTKKNEIATKDEYSSPSATGLAIRKSGLNFRHVYPTKVEQKEIQELKKKVQKQTIKERY